MQVKRFLGFALLGVSTLLVASCGGSSSDESSSKTTTTAKVAVTTPEPTCESSVPYESGTGGYDTYRIPATVATDKGTVLAFAEGRRDSSADHGSIDTLVRRSSDGGCNWEPVQVVTSGVGENRNNPAVVFDPKTKRVIVLTLVRSEKATELQIRSGQAIGADGMRVFQQESTDDGETFSEPKEITDQTKEAHWRWNVVGPGHGVVLTKGDHAGRIVFGANHSVPPAEGSTDNPMADKFLAAHSIYSDDNGETWQVGFIQENTDGVINGNETTAAELADGRVYFNTRNQNGSAEVNRAGAFSDDGGKTLVAPFTSTESLAQIPVIEASLLQLRGDDAPLLLSAPSVPTAREAMTIFASTDGAKTWSVALKISDAPAAYSDLVQLDDDTIGLLYETGEASENETITFLRVPVSSLTR